MKQIVELKKMALDNYKVIGLTNRLDPEVGSYLNTKEAGCLIQSARQVGSTLTVKVK